MSAAHGAGRGAGRVAGYVVVCVALFVAGAVVAWETLDEGESAAGTTADAEVAAAVASTTSSTTPTTTTTTTTTLPPPREATLAFTGDLLPHSPVVNTADANAADGWDFRPMFDEVRPILSAADVAICHLETPLSRDDTDLSGYPVFNAPRALAEAAATPATTVAAPRRTTPSTRGPTACSPPST